MFVLQQCKIDLYDCIKDGKVKQECLKEYKNCMAVLIPTEPLFVVSLSEIRFVAIGAAKIHY